MKRTTTYNLMGIISSKAVKVENVILRYSGNVSDTEIMEIGKFIDSLKHLEESGIFSDSVDWKYEIIHTPEGIIVMVNGYLGAAYTICKMEFTLRACDNIENGDLEKRLNRTVFSHLIA